MNFSQLQERVRQELLRRIERGTLSVSLLARQTGLGQAHVSNFLRGRRGLSLGTLDKMLAALRLGIEDLLPKQRDEYSEKYFEDVVRVPLVSHSVAIFEPYMRPSGTEVLLPFPVRVVAGVEARCPAARRHWDRFVAVRISKEEAEAMRPVLQAGAVVLLDRHYTSFKPYRAGMTNLYGARVDSRLVVRYAQFQAERVVLRRFHGEANVEVVEVGDGESPSDVLVGRVVVVMNSG